MTDDKARKDVSIPYHFGVPLDTALARRERLADRYDYHFGQERIFPDLVDALLEEVPEGSRVLEVGAATGLLTRPLLGRAASLTALEPSEGMLRRLMESDVASDERLTTRQGLVEDLPLEKNYDTAVVTFTPRRGMGLVHLLIELAQRVDDSVVMLLDEDGTLDWAYVARSASSHGFDVRLHLVIEECSCREGIEPRRAVILVAKTETWCSEVETEDSWEFEARTIDVPYPSPRGAATRLVRYFLAGGDRVIVARTDKAGLDRLYGNLRTAVHRLGRDEVTVRRIDDGIQIVRLPKTSE